MQNSISTNSELIVREREFLHEADNDSPIIRVRDLNVWYGDTKALSDVNIDIMRNRITAFIGPSGCGKTTLLRCLNRMNDLIKSFRKTGSITLDGEDMYSSKTDVMQLRKKVGMVFQQPNPFIKSIYDNMKLPVRENLSRMDRKAEKDLIIGKLQDSTLYDEVKDRLHQSAVKLSGGQQQRLCIARALTIDPEIILFDEPCSALDPISTMKIEDLLLKLKEKYTIVIVTHNLEQAGRIADYVAFFYQGRIEEQGLAQDIYLKPKSKLTEDYLRGVF